MQSGSNDFFTVKYSFTNDNNACGRLRLAKGDYQKLNSIRMTFSSA